MHILTSKIRRSDLWASKILLAEDCKKYHKLSKVIKLSLCLHVITDKFKCATIVPMVSNYMTKVIILCSKYLNKRIYQRLTKIVLTVVGEGGGGNNERKGPQKRKRESAEVEGGY